MPKNAKIYIALIVTLGFALLAGCLVFRAEFPDLPRYFSYLLLAVLASTMKVRLPGITGTISVNFLFILIGIADFTLAETLTMGCLAIATQCLWRTKSTPRPVQVVFNVAALAVSIAAAYQVSHYAMALAKAESLSAMLALAACVFFLSNTLLISGVLCLVEGKPLGKIWQQCYLWSFPYYLVGSAIAGLVTVSSRAIGWQGSLLVLPLMYLVYTFYRLYLARVVPEPDQFAAAKSA
jgi:Ca2+/Na+ antiporter